MFDADRVVFLVAVGLSLVGLDFGGTRSGCSGLEGADFPPRPRVRAGVSSCRELRLCDARVGWLRGAGIEWIDNYYPRFEMRRLFAMTD